eukprot:3323546-Pyramimonas_sp.AAC.1
MRDLRPFTNRPAGGGRPRPCGPAKLEPSAAHGQRPSRRCCCPPASSVAWAAGRGRRRGTIDKKKRKR